MEISDLLYEMVYESPHLTSEQCEQFIALVDHLGYSIADIKSFDELTPKEKEILEPLREFFI